MSLAATFNKALNRDSSNRTANSSGDNPFLQDQTANSIQNGHQVGIDDGMRNLSVNNNNSNTLPTTPQSIAPEQFHTPGNGDSGASSSFINTPSSSQEPLVHHQRQLSRNVSVPTSFLRHRSDSRVSYIDSSVNQTALYSPSHSNASSARNSTIEPKNSTTFSDGANDTASKRRSFNLVPSSDSTKSQQRHQNAKVDRVLDIPKNTPQELIPIVTLFNSQQARVYKEGYFQLTMEKVTSRNTPLSSSNDIRNMYTSATNTISCFGTLSGNELAIWDINQSDFKPIYINVADASFTNYFDITTIKIINPSSTNYYLKFETLEHHKAWFAALILSYFEFNSLHEAYTGALLSAKAVYLTDIKALLAESRYSIGEWCNIKLNYISSKWLKVYIVVVPKQKDKPGHVNIYSSDKTSNKKNLIMTINQGFSTFSVYPLIPEAVDNSSLLRVEGEIIVHNWKYLLSKGVSNNTSAIPPSPIYASNSETNSKSGNRSRSSSLSSIKIGRGKSSLSLNSRDSESVSNVNTTNSSLDANLGAVASINHFVSSLYIIPEPHPSVANFEIMIRFLIPLFDAFELYGRPKRLKSDKTNLNSLLFALPVLPKSKYLDYDEAFRLVNAKISGLPIEREAPGFGNKKLVTTTTTSSKKVQKKKSKSILSVFKKSKDPEPEVTINNAAPVPEAPQEFNSPLPLDKWTNREWLFFLKYELKYKLSLGYDGAGHLIQDFDQ